MNLIATLGPRPIERMREMANDATKGGGGVRDEMTPSMPDEKCTYCEPQIRSSSRTKPFERSDSNPREFPHR